MTSAAVRAQVAESRRRQGLPTTITDPVLLSQLAAALAEREEVVDEQVA